MTHPEDTPQPQQAIARFMREEDDAIWLYMRIYCHKIEGDTVLIHLVAPLKQFLQEQKMVNSFFFVRFFEGGHHLRVRFCGKKSHMLGSVRDTLNYHMNRYFTQHGFPLQHPLDEGPNGTDDRLWTPRLQKSIPRPIPSYEYDRYEPEIERYGGTQGLRVSERHFANCSDIVLRVLAQERSGASSRKNVVLLLIDALATAFHLTNQDKALAFEQHFLYWVASSWCKPEHSVLFAQEYERHRLTLVLLLASSEPQPEERNRTSWVSIIAAWREAVDETYEALVLLEKHELLTVSCVEIMFSYLHMLCNRLGIFPREEAYLVYLLFRYYAEQSEGTLSQTKPHSA